MPKRPAAAVADGGSPEEGVQGRGGVPTYGPRSRAGPRLSDPRRRLPYSQPSLCVRVQRESECKRPKQTFKASWVGVKGEGMVKLLGGESRHTGKAKPVRGFSTRRQCGPRTQTSLRRPGGGVCVQGAPPAPLRSPSWALTSAASCPGLRAPAANGPLLDLGDCLLLHGV